MKERSIQLVEKVFPTIKYLTREMVLPYMEAQFTLVTPAVHIHYGSIQSLDWTGGLDRWTGLVD